MNVSKAFEESLKFLAEETSDLYIPTDVPKLEYVPSSLQFLRNWVNPNLPLLIKGGAKDWPALHKWNAKYLTQLLGDKKVSVAVTPNGYADDIGQNEQGKPMFILPEERSITISDLFSKLGGGDKFSDPSVGKSEGIFYLQKQDSNLTKEFSDLLPDIDSDLEWATSAFGSHCSATNLWIGDARSVTSLHKDPFENIYCVISGYKDFILLPPTDRPWLPYLTLPVGQYKEIEPGKFVVENALEEEGRPSKVPWIHLNPVEPDLERYPAYSNAHPIHVRVEAGDFLYLPSLWYHHVRQSDGCIAVNFWYDMAMDIKFAYFQFLEHIVNAEEEEDKQKFGKI